ncbi:MAG: SEL1-like repeat protein [Deltaproteobacteria bacterium]|jgi:TPR repeat protein|nr:SEL1-like repeat protein [Deltaproteobacteria bacterium]
MKSASEFDGMLEKANQNDPKAQYAVAKAYLDGRVVAKNYQLGLEWCEKAAQNNHAYAQFHLGHLKTREATQTLSGLIPPFANSFGVDLNPVGVSPIFVRIPNAALSVNNAQNFQKVVEAYQKAQRTPAYQDARNQLLVGLDWLEKAAAQGQMEAQYELAELYQTGGPFPHDLKKSVMFAEMASDKGHSGATAMLSNMNQRGIDGVLKANRAKSLELLKKASRLGDLPSQNLLALKLIYGEDVERQDQPGALQLLEKAANAGYSKSLYNLAICHYCGVGAKKDPEKAIQLLQTIVDQAELVVNTLNKMLAGSKEISIYGGLVY